MAKSETAILTMTGDNALTIGFMGAILYVGALLIAQCWMAMKANMASEDSTNAS
jgi:hypothetical protein